MGKCRPCLLTSMAQASVVNMAPVVSFFRLAKILLLLVALFVLLGLQRACQLLDRAPAPAVCLVPELRARPFALVTYRAAAWPDLDRKRLAPSDSSRPGPRPQWRGFRGPAYHVGPWPRPVRVLRDSSGRVVRLAK